jgi:predicted nucleic acid-binding protein
MKVLFDTNIILDLLLDRKPFSENAAYLFSLVEKSVINGYLSATTVTTVHYLLQKSTGSKSASRHIKTMLSLFDIAPVTRIVLDDALNIPFSDYEDAVIHESARHAGVQYIITRDLSGFKKAKLYVLTPDEFIRILESTE